MTSITRGQYRAAFQKEQEVKYPTVDAIERETGYALDYKWLWEAASVLACPVKVNPPNWQHGRVIYATLRQYVNSEPETPICCVDVGTAKGFSALCAARALHDSQTPGAVYSCDVIDPLERTERNSIADCTAPSTVPELLAAWPTLTRRVKLEKGTGVSLLKSGLSRVHFAFLDGKHKYEAVQEELGLLSRRQQKGDIVIADDLQVSGVERAVTERADYSLRIVTLLRHRRHAIMTRR